MKKFTMCFIFELLILTGCNNKSGMIEYEYINYSIIMGENIDDGAYLFTRKDCSACIELIDLINNHDTNIINSSKDLKINVIETTELSLEEKAEVIHKYDVAYVPKIIRILNGKIVYEKVGSFSKENITDVLTELFKEEIK